MIFRITFGEKMAYRKRKFAPGECMHIYQRTINGYNIFYDLEDFIVFYTIAVCFLVVQHSIYGAQFNDYLLMSIEVAIFIFFSFIEIMKETPSVETGGASF